MASVSPSRPMYTGSGSSTPTMRPRHRSRPKRRRARRRAVRRWTSMSRSRAFWPPPPRVLRAASRRSDRSATDCSRLAAMAAKCCSSSSISSGAALARRRSGRSKALVVTGFTASTPIRVLRHRSRRGGTRRVRRAPERGGRIGDRLNAGVSRGSCRTGRRSSDASFPQVARGSAQRFCGRTRSLPQAPGCAIRWKWQGAHRAPFSCAPRGRTATPLPMSAGRRRRHHRQTAGPRRRQP